MSNQSSKYTNQPARISKPSQKGPAGGRQRSTFADSSPCPQGEDYPVLTNLDDGKKKQLITQIQDFIANDKPDKLIKVAEAIGCRFAKLGLATSQIRNIFSMARQIRMNWTDENNLFRQAVLLSPKVTYQAKRLSEKKEKDKKLKELSELFELVLVSALEVVIRETDAGRQRLCFEHFTDFFEAVVAYHKKYGGREHRSN